MTASRREFLQQSAAAAAAGGRASSALAHPAYAAPPAFTGDASHKDLALRAIDAAYLDATRAIVAAGRRAGALVVIAHP